MRAESALATVTFWLAALVAFVYIAFGVLHPALGDWNSQTDRFIFLIVVAGGGLLIVAGLMLYRSRPWHAAILIGAGAVAGAIGLVWTLVFPVLALVLIVLCIRRARSNGGAARSAPATS
jgi:hypothetical protein